MQVTAAEVKALLAENGDADNLPVEFKRRVLAVLQRDHDRTVRFVNELEVEIEQTARCGDAETAGMKQAILDAVLEKESELCTVIDWLMDEIAKATVEPETAGAIADLWARVRQRDRPSV
jgi:hypothetical protein